LLALVDELPPRALYLLTDHHEVPFEDDGLRDGEELRGWMTERFVEALEQRGVPWLRMSGSPATRVAAALARIDEIAARRLSFAAPQPEKS
jgi:nicotinamide riboside kinase